MARSLTSAVAVMVAFLSTTACENDAEHFATLNALVREGANQQEVVRRLGDAGKVYERGSYHWNGLRELLDREPRNRLVPLRKAVEKYPRIIYYTTAYRMTWIFLDDGGIVRDYYVTVQ